MDDRIIGLYAAGLSTRDIRTHLEDVYGLRVSADLISRVTAVLLTRLGWTSRAYLPDGIRRRIIRSDTADNPVLW
jgi:transposase-like protein